MSKKPLGRKEIAEIGRLAAMPDSRIDTADIPEAPAENWRHASRGDLYRPVKRPVTIRLDADVVAWFKDRAANGGYQSEINRVLRRHVAEADRPRKRASRR
jgi:uncharacterized protein (DUF4415 family)